MYIIMALSEVCVWTSINVGHFPASARG